MSAETVNVYVSYCEECDWESEQYDFSIDADRAGERHDEDRHSDEDDFESEDQPPLTPREEYQAQLDRLLQEVVERNGR